MQNGTQSVSVVVVVISGKGGVGKSTVASQLALGMWSKGMTVGLLDTDFCGPSIPRILGLEDRKVHACPEGWMPIYADGPMQRLRVMSIGFLVDQPDTAVVWRGPRKSSMIETMLNSVCWGQLDCLVIDTPPGTSDEHLTVLNQIQQLPEDKVAGAVIVSTPQRVSLCDVRREIGFCSKTGLKILGLVENMSGYRCSNCSHCCNLFSSGGAEFLAKEKQLPFLGRLPLDSALTALCDSADRFDLKSHTTEDTMKILQELFRHCPTLASACPE
ncbi:hypothetical protein T265_06032 [Opisthorchis viverrini]|uniref:Cytosolic Fe-S cluster assembly factor NUBP2 homolog n=1 Tax=Opisthorchis viverrini TaxID=6198 RepID=A0A075AEI2_OPIVI|nr:hypothetical protein T265_06032 [Opisthorchis viverrini]KER26744.1 hypothetical protein T265_06032 [Opisthorchis viverrini]